MPTTTQASPSDRKAAIIAAATEGFAVNGYSGTSIDEIGALVGVTGPAIYRHFKGKDALLESVLFEAIDAFVPPADIPAGDLHALALHAVSNALDHPGRLVAHQRERHRLRGDARAELLRREGELLRPLRDALAIANPTMDLTEFARRHRAIATALSVIAPRVQAKERPALEHLLTESVLAVFAAPPLPPRSRSNDAGSWSLTPTRREQILTAALGLFRQRGFHDVTMDEIGDAAGITGPSVYFHYASKSEVLADAHERASVRVSVGVQDAVRSASSASDALDRLAHVQLGVAADHSDLILVTSRETAPLEQEDRERFARRAYDIIDVWVAVLGELRPDLDGSELRSVVLGVFPLMNQTAYLLDDPSDGVPLIRAWLLGGGTPTGP